MDPRPLVSVIIPFYETPVRFLREAVASALAQTYPHREILLVDDGSRGECRDVAMSYAGDSAAQVRCLHHEGHANRGTHASRRLGLAHARGELVALLDADDVWLPGKLEEQVAILRSCPRAAMLYGNSLYWYSWSGRPEDEERDYLPPLGFSSDTLVDPPGLLPRYLSGSAAVPATCSVLARRDVLERLGAFEGTFVRAYEDQVTYAKVCLEAPVLVVVACWDRYRQHPASSCAKLSTREDRANREAFLSWLEAYLAKRRIDDRRVWKALRREQWELRHPFLGRAIRKARKASRPWAYRQRRGPRA